MDADLPPFEREVLSVVHTALSAHGADAAEVDLEWSAGMGGWFIEVTPRRVDAAKVSVGCDGDELLLSFGHTRLELWRSKRGSPTPIDRLREFLPAIFSGDFEESGTGDDRFARVNLPNGRTPIVGVIHLPFPWALRRRHRYASYS